MTSVEALDEPPLRGLARNASLQFLARAGAGVFQASSLVLAARYLGPDAYGHLALVVTLRTMTLIIAELGLTLVIVRRLVLSGEETSLMRNVLGVRLALGGLAAVVLVGAAVAASDSADVREGALVAGLSFAPFAYFGLAQTRAQQVMRLGGLAQAALAGAGAGLAWTGLVLAFGGGVVMLSASLVVASLVSAGVGMLLAPGARLPLRPAADLVLWRKLASEALPLGLSFGLVNLYLYADLALLSRLSAPAQVGYYDSAFRFVQFGVIVPAAITSSLYARAVYYAGTDRARFAELSRNVLRLGVLLAPVPILVMTLLPEGVLSTLYGDAYRPGANALAWLGPALSLMILSGVVGPVLISLGFDRATLALGAVATAINVGINLAIIPRLASEGAAITTLITESFVIAVASALLWRSVKVGLPLRALACAGLGGAAAAAVIAVLPGPAAVRIGAGVTLYVILALALAPVAGLKREAFRTPARADG